MCYPIPLNQPGNDAVLKLLNRDNGTNESFSTISFGLPVPTPTGYKRNTKLRVSAIPGKKRKGFIDVYYNRIDFSDYFTVHPVEIDPLGLLTTHQAIPFINQLFDLHLLPEDIVNEPISSDTFTLKATLHSFAWRGQVQFHSGGVAPANGTYLDVGGGVLFGTDTMTLLDIS